MAYELHIERDDEIPLDEWLSVVESIENIRTNNEDIVAKNPHTGVEIRMAASEGDVEVYFQEINSWQRVYRFNGRGSFRVPSNWNESNAEIRHITFKLAKALNAKVVGDEGEVYDESGQSNWQSQFSSSQRTPSNKKWWQFWK